MKLERAIEVLKEGSELSQPWLLKDYEAALQLGIEALKRVDECRLADHTIKEDLLPGEDK